MRKAVKSVRDIVDWRLCLGCGACAYVCPDQKIQLVDVIDEGFRPFIAGDGCGSCRVCFDVCPSWENDHRKINSEKGLVEEMKSSCGPVMEVWEGHAADPAIRIAGSSGGLITALSLYCLNEEGMHGVLHIGQDPDDPLRNRTRMSRTREDLIRRTGSRYAPAAACDSLHLIEDAPRPCVFIGQPSEVTALRKAQRLRPLLAEKTGLAISFFCAGSPSRLGTIKLLEKMGINPEDVEDLRYRGNGWPGMFSVKVKDEQESPRQMSYRQSWGFIQAYRPFATHLCPDGTGEDADLSCGDPWYRELEEGEAGSSLVLVRTETGRRIIRGAIDAGYITMKPSEPWKVIESQRNLIAKRGAIWGRIATLRILGLPAPKLRGFSLFRNWLALSLKEKLRSTVGTARRAVMRGYFKRLRLEGNEHS